MPVFRSLDYSTIDTWDHIILEHRVKINRHFNGPKCQFHMNMNLEYEFMKINHGWMKLRFIFKEHIICKARIKYNDEEFTVVYDIKSFRKLLQ